MRPGRWLAALLAPRGSSRTLQAATFFEAVALGILMTVLVLFLVRDRGLGVQDMGLALTVSGLVGLVTGVPLGRLADRVPVRPLLVLGVAGEAVFVLLYVAAVGLVSLVVVATGFVLASQVAYGARGVYMTQLFVPDERIQNRARLRATNNLGAALGGLFGGVGLALTGIGGTSGSVVVAGTLFFVSAACSTRLPQLPVNFVEERDASGGGRALLGVLADRRYLLTILLCSCMATHVAVLEVALPLWISDHTPAPAWVIGAIVVLNTGLVVALQMPLSRGTDLAVPAAKRHRTAGLLLAASSVVFGAAAWTDGAIVATAVLLVGAVLYGLGEITQAAGAWGLSYALGPDARMGEYQAAFGTGTEAAARIAPILATGIVLAWAPLGWWLAAGWFAFIAALSPAITRGWHEEAASPALTGTPT